MFLKVRDIKSVVFWNTLWKQNVKRLKTLDFTEFSKKTGKIAAGPWILLGSVYKGVLQQL